MVVPGPAGEDRLWKAYNEVQLEVTTLNSTPHWKSFATFQVHTRVHGESFSAGYSRIRVLTTPAGV
eukprot:1319001-Rhodomonas_salina.2